MSFGHALAGSTTPNIDALLLAAGGALLADALASGGMGVALSAGAADPTCAGVAAGGVTHAKLTPKRSAAMAVKKRAGVR